jgi:hypothetical protein
MPSSVHVYMLAAGDIFSPFVFRGRGWGWGARGSAVLPTSVSCLGFSRNIPPSHQPPCMSFSAYLIDRAPTPHRARRHRLVKNTNSQASLCIANVGPFFSLAHSYGKNIPFQHGCCSPCPLGCRTVSEPKVRARNVGASHSVFLCAHEMGASRQAQRYDCTDHKNKRIRDFLKFAFL